jgi:protocatechuate 3,4-dioxygenase beta subunit
MLALSPRHPEDHPPALTPGYRSSMLRAPEQALVTVAPGPAELLAPRFTAADFGPLDHDLLRNHSVEGGLPIGERLMVHGVVRDTAGRPLPGVLIEVWQANAGGRYRHALDGYQLAPLDPHFGGAGRLLSDAQGRYHFFTVKPGPYPWNNGPGNPRWRPAHVHLALLGSAWAQRLITQMYFEGDPLLAQCPILNTVPSEAQRRALIALQDEAGFVAHDLRAYRFDITLRGAAATWFEAPP